MGIKRIINVSKDFFTSEVWHMDTTEVSKRRARLVKYAKVVQITFKTFANQKIGFQAVALSYFSTMSIIPFLAFVFAITGGLGLSGKLTELIQNTFSSVPSAVNLLLNKANAIIDTAKSGAIGAISAISFVWLVIWMMFQVERVFNNVWKVKKQRNIIKRFSFYLAILVISPFLILILFSGPLAYSNLFGWVGFDINNLPIISTILPWLLFYIIATFTFSLMFKYIPAAQVDYKNSLYASIIIAVIFTVFQFLYLETQLFVTKWNVVFGALAAIPLYMIWMNISWQIILYGAELSYAFQNVDNYNLEDI